MKKMIVGASFPNKITQTEVIANRPNDEWHFNGFPGVLHVLPQGNNVYYFDRHDDLLSVDDSNVEMYVIEFWEKPSPAFQEWMRARRDKIVAGGYLVHGEPEYFKEFASRLVMGYCDNLEATLANTSTHPIYEGVMDFTTLPRYDVFAYNELSDKHNIDRVAPLRGGYGLFTSLGCYNNCDFCVATFGGMYGNFIEKPPEQVRAEAELMVKLYGRQPNCCIYDPNFLQSRNWRQNLAILNEVGVADHYDIYGSANALRKGDAELLAGYNVKRILIGLEDINKSYIKNRNLKWACDQLNEAGIDIIMTYIIDPERVIDPEAEMQVYHKLANTFVQLRPAEVRGSFLLVYPDSEIHRQYSKRADFDMERYQREVIKGNTSLLEVAKFFVGSERAQQMVNRYIAFLRVANQDFVKSAGKY